MLWIHFAPDTILMFPVELMVSEPSVLIQLSSALSFLLKFYLDIYHQVV